MFNFLFQKLTPEPEYSGDCKIFSLLQKFFERAHQEGCNEMLFGVPPGESASENKKELEDEFQKNWEETSQFALEQGLEIKVPDKIEISDIPIWMKRENEWHEIFSLPSSLLHECIRALNFYSKEFSTSTVKVELPLDDKTAYANLNLNENYNYILTDIRIK